MNIGLPYCVYILFSELDKQLYVGFTSDINKRLEDHNNGRNLSTKNRRPFKLIFLKYYLFKEDAMYREFYFKSSKGKRMLKLLLVTTFDKLGYQSINKKED